MTLVYLALYKGRGLIGNAVIRAWTRSPYSHCELVIGGLGYSSSLMDGGVRAKRIDWDSGNWDLIPVPWVRMEDVLAHYESTKGRSYSWLDLIRSQMFNTTANQPDADFCSEWCAAAMGVPSETLYSPASLGRLVIFLNQHCCARTHTQSAMTGQRANFAL